MSLRTILFLVNAVALVVFVVVAVLASRRRESPVPHNQSEYYDDKVLEGPKLERYLGAAVLFSAVLAAALPIYWLLEPTRQEGMEADFVSDAVQRGQERFGMEAEPGSEILPLECARCHGENAEGGTAPFVILPQTEDEVARQVQWEAPSLDDVLLRFSEEEVTQIITYGRPGTPMPAWGLEGGGPLPEQPVADLVAFLESIQITPEEAKQRSAERLEAFLEENPAVGPGEALFNLNCARCHTKGSSYGVPAVSGGGGAFGPNLTGGVLLRQFPGADGLANHIAFVTDGSDFQTPYGTQGIGSGRMPGFGEVLTEEQIELIVAYERGL